MTLEDRVSRLLEQCDREDKNPEGQRYLHTVEIRRLLGMRAVSSEHKIKRYSRWIFGPTELPGHYTPEDHVTNYGASWRDCDQCNYIRHQCGGCGEELNHDGTEGTEYGPERLHPNCWED